MRNAVFPFALLSSVALLAPPSQAQTCGPLTFAFGVTGAGCPDTGLATILSANLLPSPSLSSCPLEFTVFPGPVVYPYYLSLPPLLVLGTTNPALDLAPFGFPGCTLFASTDAIAPMAPSTTWPGAFSLSVLVPASPVLIGVTGYAQSVTLVGPGIPLPVLSNGLSVGIS